MTGVSVGQISVAMHRCPTVTKNQFHGPSLQDTDVPSLPSLPPGPSSLVTVPASLLEKDGQYKVILCISDHCLEGLCSAALWQLIWVGCWDSSLRPERDRVQHGGSPGNHPTDPTAPTLLCASAAATAFIYSCSGVDLEPCPVLSEHQQADPWLAAVSSGYVHSRWRSCPRHRAALRPPAGGGRFPRCFLPKRGRAVGSHAQLCWRFDKPLRSFRHLHVSSRRISAMTSPTCFLYR